jgi:transposase InsO family protein
MTVSRRRVARIMREHGFVGAHTRERWRRGRPDSAPAADHPQRVFTAQRPNLRWVADITEFPTGEGKLHLAAIRDLCRRGIVGWAMDEHQDAQLVVDALTMALGRTAPEPDGLIHHSGSEYVGGPAPSRPLTEMPATWVDANGGPRTRSTRARGLPPCLSVPVRASSGVRRGADDRGRERS